MPISTSHTALRLEKRRCRFGRHLEKAHKRSRSISSECCECICKPILSEMPAHQLSPVACDTFRSQGQVLDFLYLLLLFLVSFNFFLLRQKHCDFFSSYLRSGKVCSKRIAIEGDLRNLLRTFVPCNIEIKHSHSLTCQPLQRAMHRRLRLCTTTTSRMIATMKTIPGSMHPLANSRMDTTTGGRTPRSRPPNAPSAATGSATGAGSARSSVAMSVLIASRRIQARGGKAVSEGRCTGISTTISLATG